MRCRALGIFLTLLTLTSGAAHAEFTVAWGLGYASTALDDPDGATDPAAGPSFINPLLIVPFGRDSRLLAHIFKNDFEVDAGVDAIGQDVSSTGVNLSYQKMLRISRSFKPWIGGGIGAANNTYNSRYRVDRDGFLVATFPNAKETVVQVLLNAGNDWTIGEKSRIGVLAQYSYGVSRNDQQVEFLVYYGYSFGR